MKQNVLNCSMRRCSPRNRTATTNCIDGATYCMNPIVARRNRRTAAANSSSGTDVITLDIASSPYVPTDSTWSVPAHGTTSTTAASGTSSDVSTVRPTTGPTSSFLRTSPYNPNDTAS